MDRITYLLILAFVLWLAWYGYRYHTVEQALSAENDRYSVLADQIAGGQIPRDPFHPLLYPILSAGLGFLAGGAFAGARLASTLMAGAALLAVHRLARECFSPPVGIFALLATALNFEFIASGFSASADMTFSALATVTVLTAVRYLRKPSPAAAVWMAATFALAYFTKFSATQLLPVILAALLLGRADSGRRKLAGAAIFTGSALLLLIPHFLLTAHAFGDPFYNENWKNFAFKLFGQGDWSYFQRVPFTGAMDMLRHVTAGAVISTTLTMLGIFAGSTFAILCGKGAAGVILAGLSAAGAAVAAFRGDAARRLLPWFAATYVLSLCILFGPAPRLILPILPVCMLLAGEALTAPLALRRPAPRWAAAGTGLVAVGILALLLHSTWIQSAWYLANQPFQERWAVRMIEERFGKEVTVYGTSHFLVRYVRYPYRFLDDAAGAERTDPARYYERMRRILGAGKADFVLIGRLSLQGRPAALLTGENVPPFLSLYYHDRDVAVYRVAPAAGPADGGSAGAPAPPAGE